MKVIFLFIFSVLNFFLVNTAISQSASNNSKWHVQVTAGTSVNYFTDAQPHRSNTLGYNAQAQVNYALKHRFNLFAEAGLAGVGGGLTSFRDDTYLGFPGTITFKNTKQSNYMIHVLESSLGLGYTLSTKQGWKIKLYTAPTLAINLGEWEKYEKTGYLIEPKDKNSVGVIGTVTNRQFVAEFQPYWFNIMGGMSLQLPYYKGAFLVDFRFVNGVTYARYDYSYLNTPGIQGNLRTNSFRAALGYTIPAFNKHSKKVKSK